VALYVAFALTFCGALATWERITRIGPAVEVFDWQSRDYASHQAVRLLQRYIAIDTGPAGEPAAGIEFVAALLRERGIEAEIERVGESDANLWAVIEGEDPRALVLHHHVDVDPVEDPELWRHPPFTGTIDGPWIYGRGAFDMKSVAVAQIEAFLRVAEQAASGRRPSRTVILLATSGEETGSELGMRWMLHQHPDLVARFDVVLTEGGAVEGREHGNVKYWGTEFVQRRVLRVTLCGDSRDRLEELRRELIAEHRSSSSTVEVSPELVAFLGHYAPTRDREDWRRLLADPVRLARDPASFRPLPDYLRSMFLNEVLPRPVEETSGGWELEISLQLVPGADGGAVLAERLGPWRTHGLAVAVYDEGAAAHGSPADHPILTEIAAVIAERYPGATVGPMYLPWTLTDARFLRARGVSVYGFSPFMVLTPEVLNLVQAGTVNERIALPGFVEGVEIYVELVERFAGAGAPPAPPRHE
jgi:acetylornithine deacetylase/succinyl-diaminopimelate desuccinylase-like protein